MGRKRKTKPASDPVPVDAIKHKDTRRNIPTRELAAFAGDDERTPKTVLYPRDPSLDPQLVWKGKDEQDQKPLEVPAVPIYIQEKIHPQALIEDIRERAAAGKSRQLDLFADFNGIDEFEKRVDFYHHDQHWSNRMILGDSLLVMTSLAEKERLKGRVQMIYVDPPYGIKFGSNWQVSTRKREVKDAKAEDATRQPEQIKAFRDTWQLGIHSYLTYLRDRLVVARDLLTETGSIFVQIGDENVHLVRCVLDEVFGRENCVAVIPFNKTAGQADKYLPKICDYKLWYARDNERLRYRQLYLQKVPGEQGATKYDSLKLGPGQIRRLTESELAGETPLPAGSQVCTIDQLTSQEYRPDTTVPFEYRGKRYHPGEQAHWKTSVEGLHRLELADRLAVQGNKIRFVRLLEDFAVTPITNVWPDIGGIQSRTDPKIYVVQTSTTAIQRCLLMTTDPGDLVLDPTCGSGTTAYVAEQWGRRWITLDTSRVALALARTRLMAAKFSYYLLADSPEGRKLSAEGSGGSRSSTHPTPTPDECSTPDAPEGRRVGRAQRDPPTATEDCGGSRSSTHPTDGTHPTNAGSPDIRRGFVYKRVPHVTLKSIANNPDIHEGMTREQIDAAISKHADTETLYDQPYEDKSIVRVAGPFTVESLSPHRMLPAGDDAPTQGLTPPAQGAII